MMIEPALCHGGGNEFGMPDKAIPGLFEAGLQAPMGAWPSSPVKPRPRGASSFG